MQRKLVSSIIVLLAIIWISLILRNSVDLFSISIASVDAKYVGLSVVMSMISVFIAAYIYLLILSRIVPTLPPAQNVMIHFVVSQVVRYLPGKIWGIIYQVYATAASVPARYTVRANLEHLALVYFNSIAVAVSMFIYQFNGITLAIGVYALMVLLFFISIRKSLIQGAISLMPRLGSVKIEHSKINAHDSKKAMLIIGLMQTEWVFYFFACALILPAQFGVESMIIISTCYATAWLISALAVMMPGGLIAREASFIWLSGLFGFESIDMLVFSVVARLVFSFSDILCSIVSLLLMQFNHREVETRKAINYY